MNAPFAIDRPDVVHRAVCDVLCAVFPTASYDILLASGRATQTTSWLRQVGMYLMVDRLHVTQLQTARYFGRDRSTVIHGIRLVEHQASERPATAAFLDFLELQVLTTLDRFAAIEAEHGSI